MSFGWSAGDIATTVTVVYNLIQALDSCDGAAADYRETVSFLRDLKRTLEPLQTFTAWDTYPTYGRDIAEHVEHIRRPVEQFLSAVQRYEPSLGATAQGGRHRHVLRKLQWHISMSKKVLSLKDKIQAHMRAIDTLMQRLTLDMVWITQQRLPNNLRATFRETLRPELIAVLRENLAPLNSTLLETHHEIRNLGRSAQDPSLTEIHEILSSGIQDIKQQISSSMVVKERIESRPQGDTPTTETEAFALVEGPKLEQSPGRRIWRSSEITVQDSLQEVYYYVFLYLGCFLKNLFLVLLRMVQPSRALTPTLLLKNNIGFLDAIGRPQRILPLEYFRCYEVLRAFIQHDFKNLPGSTWVKRGRYLILGVANGHVLNEYNWDNVVVPGTIIAMCMLLRRKPASYLSLKEQRYPASSCPGTRTRSKTKSWAGCTVGQREISFSYTSSNSDQSRKIDKKAHLDNDISTFKRVVRQFVGGR